MQDLDLSSVRTAADLKKQADVLKQIADVKMDEYMLTAPEPVKKLQDRGIPKEAIFGLSGTVLLISSLAMLVLYGAQILSVFVSVLQPLYYSYKALETPQQDDDTVWLTYWMVHGVLFMMEYTVFLPLVHFLPALYFMVKIALQFWMVNFEGSTLIYTRYLAPLFRKHEQELDEKINLAKENMLAATNVVKPTHKPAGDEPDAGEDDI